MILVSDEGKDEMSEKKFEKGREREGGWWGR
jgi:hypothetical protein